MVTEAQDEGHPAGWPEKRLLQDCLVRRTRHGGPGGQHRNKVETAIEIVHQPSGIVAGAVERRSQEANRGVAVDRLRLLLAVRVRTVRSGEVTPSDLWIQRCPRQRIVCSEGHADFPGLLAEALDAILAKEFDVARAAAALGCSATQLIRFVSRVAEALEWVNTERQARGLRRLHA